MVKGCPTDINGNGVDDDDYNNDGYVDQCDQDYFDGYMTSYNPPEIWDLDDPGEIFWQGYMDGGNDQIDDIMNPENGTQGADILNGDVDPTYDCVPEFVSNY